MARLLDANHAFVGGEPKFSYELSKMELIRTLNWYSQNKTDKDAYNYYKKEVLCLSITQKKFYYLF